MSVDFSEIKDLLDIQDNNWQDFKKSNDSRLKTLESELGNVLKKQGRVGAGAGDNVFASPNRAAPQFIDTKTRQVVPVLEHKASLAALQNKSGDTESVGRMLRGLVMGGAADDHKELSEERKSLGVTPDPSGGYTVGAELSAQWIDKIRASMVLSRAGALTIPMGTAELNLARVTADPDVYWKKENADITPSDPTFGQLKLQAKTVLCLTKLSVELAQDSGNIQEILSSTLTNAIASAIDSAGLVGVTAGAAGAPGGIFNQSGRNTVLSVGAPTSWDWVIDSIYELLADNVPAEEIGALIGHPAIFKKMAKLKSGISSDNTPLVMPESVARLPKYWTTSAPLTSGTTAKAVLGKWSDYLFGIRQDIQVKILTEAFMGSSLQLGVLVYARCDFGATRPTSFVTAEGITV